jgi:GMP synthase-like glutamine amidotransferase
MRALFIQHDHVSPVGPLGDAFAARGFAVEELVVVPPERFGTPDVEVRFPDPTGYDVVVPMGAPWSVYDRAAIGTWVTPELDLLRRAHSAGVPVFGVCFGGQALALALGGTVERAPGPEIGWTTVVSDAPDLVEPGPWFQWHHDRWTDPPGVRSLARTPLAPQVFVAGRSLGLQFHPELTVEMLKGWLGNGGDEHLGGLGVDADALLARTRVEEPAAVERAYRLVEVFLDRVATADLDGPWRGGGPGSVAGG